MKKQVSIVIPAFNEEGNLCILIEDLEEILTQVDFSYEIIIVEDNSSDLTGDIADNLARKHDNLSVIHRRGGTNGLGAALIDGSHHAIGRYVIWVMGDLSDDLKTLPNLIHKLEMGYDMVIGSRYMDGGSRGELSRIKAFLSSGYTTICRILFNIPLHDITNAFRVFRKDILMEINSPLSNDYAISPEFTIIAHLEGYKLGEVPTTYFNRRKGKSKFNFFNMGMRYALLFKYRFVRTY